MLSKKTALAVAGGVLVVGAGVGAATVASADPTPSANPSASASSGVTPGTAANPPKGKHGWRGERMSADDLATKLSEKLGVDQAKVAEAIKAYRDANKPTPGTKPDPSTRPDPSAREAALAKAVADKLGIDEAQVKTALDEIRSEAKRAAQAQGETRLKERLASAVKGGTLTQSEADAVLKAYQKGVIGPR
jgi:hypothetical protein